MAPHPQLPVCICTKLAASLASSCKSASPGIPQRLRLHLPDPTDSSARSGQLVLAQNWIAEKGGRGLGCLGGGARNDSHQVVCRFFMCRFARTQPGGSGLERAGSHARSFLVWDTGVAWAETLSLGAWAALAAALETIRIKSCVGFSCVYSRGRSLEDLAWRKAGSHARSFLVWDKGIA